MGTCYIPPVRVIARSTLVEFWKLHPDSEKSLRSWFSEAGAAEWKNPAEIKAKYRSASILKNNRAVFNICGNKYRLVCSVLFEQRILYVKFLGTHADYDKLDAEVYDEEPVKGHKKRKGL